MNNNNKISNINKDLISYFNYNYDICNIIDNTKYESKYLRIKLKPIELKHISTIISNSNKICFNNNYNKYLKENSTTKNLKKNKITKINNNNDYTNKLPTLTKEIAAKLNFFIKALSSLDNLISALNNKDSNEFNICFDTYLLLYEVYKSSNIQKILYNCNLERKNNLYKRLNMEDALNSMLIIKNKNNNKIISERNLHNVNNNNDINKNLYKSSKSLFDKKDKYNNVNSFDLKTYYTEHTSEFIKNITFRHCCIISLFNQNKLKTINEYFLLKSECFNISNIITNKIINNIMQKFINTKYTNNKLNHNLSNSNTCLKLNKFIDNKEIIKILEHKICEKREEAINNKKNKIISIVRSLDSLTNINKNQKTNNITSNLSNSFSNDSKKSTKNQFNTNNLDLVNSNLNININNKYNNELELKFYKLNNNQESTFDYKLNELIENYNKKVRKKLQENTKKNNLQKVINLFNNIDKQYINKNNYKKTCSISKFDNIYNIGLKQYLDKNK